MQRRRNLENSVVRTLLVRGSRLAFRATMSRAERDLDAYWNTILTIFDPYRFHTVRVKGCCSHRASAITNPVRSTSDSGHADDRWPQWRFVPKRDLPGPEDNLSKADGIERWQLKPRVDEAGPEVGVCVGPGDALGYAHFLLAAGRGRGRLRRDPLDQRSVARACQTLFAERLLDL